MNGHTGVLAPMYVSAATRWGHRRPRRRPQCAAAQDSRSVPGPGRSTRPGDRGRGAHPWRRWPEASTTWPPFPPRQVASPPLEHAAQLRPPEDPAVEPELADSLGGPGCPGLGQPHRHVQCRHHLLQGDTVFSDLRGQPVKDVCLAPLALARGQPTGKAAPGHRPGCPPSPDTSVGLEARLSTRTGLTRRQDRLSRMRRSAACRSRSSAARSRMSAIRSRSSAMSSADRPVVRVRRDAGLHRGEQSDRSERRLPVRRRLQLAATCCRLAWLQRPTCRGRLGAVV